MLQQCLQMQVTKMLLQLVQDLQVSETIKKDMFVKNIQYEKVKIFYEKITTLLDEMAPYKKTQPLFRLNILKQKMLKF